MDYVSPAVAAAATSVRTPDDVLNSRRIGRCYVIESPWKAGTYFEETYAQLPKGKDQDIADALSDLRESDDAVAIWELNPGAGTMRNVSKEFALLWVDELLKDSGFDTRDAATWPQFVGRYLTNDEAEARHV